jgi:hypothetical protein
VRSVLRVVKAGWVYAAVLAMGVVFLAIGNEAGQIIGGALLAFLVLVLAYLAAARRGTIRATVSLKSGVRVYRLYAVIGLIVIAPGI